MVEAVVGEVYRSTLLHLNMVLVVVEEGEESVEVARMTKIVLNPYCFQTHPMFLD